MARARKIMIKTRTFDKAGDATAFFKEMLNRYGIDDRVSPADADDLSALLDRHDERDEKIGIGIGHFEVRLPPKDAPPFSQKCFWIFRTDGSMIDISYKHCLEPKPYD